MRSNGPMTLDVVIGLVILIYALVGLAWLGLTRHR